MFDTSFSYKSAKPLPPTIVISDALSILHDFDTVNRLNPDVRGSKPIPPPKNAPKTAIPPTPAIATPAPNVKLGEPQYFEVEDSLPFIPSKLWSGGVRYQADFVPVEQGCDITIHAPGGFTSVNHWRLVHDESRIATVPEENDDHSEKDEVAQVTTKDLMHVDTDSGGWFVQILTDARCSRTFAGFVKGFLKNSHAQLENAFVDRCVEKLNAPPVKTRPRRPTVGRRRSSVF